MKARFAFSETGRLPALTGYCLIAVRMQYVWWIEDQRQHLSDPSFAGALPPVVVAASQFCGWVFLAAAALLLVFAEPRLK